MVQKYMETFQKFIPLIHQRLLEKIQDQKTGSPNVGSPLTTDLKLLIEAVFFVCDSGAQHKWVKHFYGIPGTTYIRYRNMLLPILDDLYSDLVRDLPITEALITDTFTVKSMDGQEGVGSNPTDRGRNGFKVSLICDTNRIVRNIDFDKASVHDHDIFQNTIQTIEPFQSQIQCLADSGYVGRSLRELCSSKNIKLIAKPRKKRNGHLTHFLTSKETKLLKRRRNQIELLNGHIRKFRSLMIKWTKKMDSYKCYLYVALLCITGYQLYG
jgi:hypothetical protein